MTSVANANPTRSLWLEGALLGVVVGAFGLWVGLAGLVLVLGLSTLLAATKQSWRFRGLLVGLGLGVAGMTLVGAAGCPAFVGLPSSSCSAPDLRPILLVALATVLVGIALTLRAAPRKS